MILEINEILIDLKNATIISVTEGYDKSFVRFYFENKNVMEMEVKTYNNALEIKRSCSRLKGREEGYEILNIDTI